MAQNTNKATPPPTPLQELQTICERATGGKVWAVGEGEDSTGTKEWCIYSSSEKTLNRLPLTYRGRKVVAFVCRRPKILKSQ